MSSTQATEALETTRTALRRLDGLVGDGWKVTHHEMAGLVEGTGSPGELIDAVKSLAPLIASAADLVGKFANASLTLRVSPEGDVAPAGPGRGDIGDNFDVDHRADASLAWSGDVEAAFRLPGEWSCRAQLKWTAKLDEVAPQTQWLLFQTLEDVVKHLHSKPFWLLQPELDTIRGTVALVRDLPADASLICAALVVLSLDADTISVPQAVRAPSSELTDPVLAKTIDPELLMPVGVGGDVARVAEALWSLVVATSWARLATALIPNPATGELEVEYFGLQRVRHALPANGPACDRNTAERSLELLQWVESAGTVDRLLAVQQVVSLRTDEPPWERAGDIRTAAAPIFMALRSGAIAEALKAVRDARTTALETARRTVEVSTSVAKTTVERALASIVAVGAIFIANTSKKITPDQASDLRLLVACALIGLGTWYVIVERPTLFRSIKDFKADLPTLSELLPVDEQAKIADLNSLNNARRHALVVAWLVPPLYLGLAVASLYVNR